MLRISKTPTEDIRQRILEDFTAEFVDPMLEEAAELRDLMRLAVSVIEVTRGFLRAGDDITGKALDDAMAAWDKKVTELQGEP